MQASHCLPSGLKQPDPEPVPAQPTKPLRKKISKYSVANKRVELRTLLVSALGTSLAAWDIAFNFAIYGGVFYDKLMAVWVVATVILLAMLLSGQRTVLGHWGILMLLLPTGWFMFIALSPAFDTAQYADDCDHHLCDGNRVCPSHFCPAF